VPEIAVIGGGLAGSEAAWQAAEWGASVRLFEMRPAQSTGAHQTGDLAELVCSNSLGSQLPDRASGVLLAELEAMGSLLVECARGTALPAGGALAVDRVAFARAVTERLAGHPRIQVIREEVRSLPPGPTVVASGPLTSEALSQELARLSGEDHLYFFDAISPIVEASSVDYEIAFRDSRYGRGVSQEGDYLNCPMDEEQYRAFVEALRRAERIPLRSFEQAIQQGVRAGLDKYFEGCLPIEVIAERGDLALAYGPLRPVGLTDPRTGRRPFAVVQLRQDNLASTLYNLVGFQTNLTYPEQRQVLRMIPGLEQARFARYGQMHRNTFLNSPRLLLRTLQFRGRSDLFFAGQITGVEGYLGNVGTGLLAGVNAARLVQGAPPLELPRETMLGALCHYVTHASPGDFQPMKANFGILPPSVGGSRRGRRARAQSYAARSRAAMQAAWPTPKGELRIATESAS
jgi:methylenetetrahydrofolate--tRNA-(uracil-5-)-methyltransferase